MASQTKTGKAFEYALLQSTYQALKSRTDIVIVENDPLITAKSCFREFNRVEQEAYNTAADKAIDFLTSLEPRLYNSLSQSDSLQLELASDALGQDGDVRDVLMIRSEQNWEIGISAKNNHRAVKHSRLSQRINFGEKWLGLPCSSTYFREIEPIFSMLETMRGENPKQRWSSIENMHEVVYVPILNAFKKELRRLDEQHKGFVAQKLVEYLIGNKDYYKVIKSRNKVEVQAYNLTGSLNQNAGRIKSKHKLKKLKLPSRLIEIVYDTDSSTTLIVSMDEGWQISFQIHNAKSTVEPSLKFDINLISAPQTLFTQHILL